MNQRPPNPYPGPRPFSPRDRSLFAGRENETDELASLIVAHRAVLLYAQSGAGKTSLFNAGVLPALEEKGVHVLPTSRVGIPLPAGLPAGEPRNVYTYSAIRDFLPNLPDEQWSWQATLAEALERVPRRTDEFGEPLIRVLALDQFEELFTRHAHRWEDRRKFFEQAAEALARDASLHMVFIVREDFLAHFTDLAFLLPEDVRTRYRLQRLREPEALLAVTQPLEGSPWSFAENVAETLVTDLLRTSVNTGAGETVDVAGEFVEPVQLQVVCYTLFENLPPERTTITTEDLRVFGNADEALRGFYEKAVAASVRKGADEKKLRVWFDTQLITSAGTRGLVFQGKQDTGGIANEIISVLEAEHLIRAEVHSGGRWYELTHDRFLPPIRASNARWREAAATHALRQRALKIGIPVFALLLLVSGIVISWAIRQADTANTEVGKVVNQQKVAEQALDRFKDALKQNLNRRVEEFQSLRSETPASAVVSLDGAIGAAISLENLGEVTRLKKVRIDFLNDPKVRQTSRTSTELRQYFCDHPYAIMGESGEHRVMENTMLKYAAEFPNAVVRDHWDERTPSVLMLDSYLTCDQATKAVLEIRKKYKSDPLIVLLYRCNRGACQTPPRETAGQ